MQAEQDNQGPCNGCQRVAVLLQERANGAGGSSEGDKHCGESAYERQCRRKKAAPRLLSLAQLFDANPAEHGNVAGHQRQDAGREKRDQAGKESRGERNVSVHSKSGSEQGSMLMDTGSVIEYSDGARLTTFLHSF